MAKKIAKILAMGVLIIMSMGAFTACSDVELKHGVYITDDGLASVTLSEDNEFTFNRGIMYSYAPTGNYNIKKSKLTLHVTYSEEYIFNIREGQLVFVSGDGSVVKGTIFKLSEQ